MKKERDNDGKVKDGYSKMKNEFWNGTERLQLLRND